MELMQGLVKMAWGARGGVEASRSREAANPSGASETMQVSSDNFRGRGAANPQAGSSSRRRRSESADSAGWSEMDLGSEKGDPNDGNRTQVNSPPLAGATSDKAEGARDIFSMPHTEQVRTCVCTLELMSLTWWMSMLPSER